MWESLKKVLGVPIVLAVVGWILFNPYILCVDSPFILNATSWVNGFCSNLDLSYRFSEFEILGLFRFLEYFVLGITTMCITRMYFKNFYQNIINAIFFGLLTAVFEAFYRSFGICRLDIHDVLYSFFGFCIGIAVICIFGGVKPKKRFLSKYRKHNYVVRG